ncbi:SEC-C domain-containing protein [Nocardiopsis sp. NPDC050513]|uniref:SEC-C domain-containing protein n=1 Tax=Nocardiopsis sp. NPDC050513 TaxID=3364338 RepID=UPI00379EB1A5
MADDALMSAVRSLDLPDGVLRDLEEYPEETGEILREAVVGLSSRGRDEQVRRLLEALREHPPTPEDGQYASIELVHRLRESGDEREAAEADRITTDLLRPGHLEEGPAGLFAEDLHSWGRLAEALRCLNIAARGYLARTVEDLEELDAFTLQPLIARANARLESGFPLDDHDRVALEAAREMLEEKPEWEEDEPDGGVEVLYSRDVLDEARARGLLTGESAEHGIDAYYRAAEGVMREGTREHPGTPRRVVLHGVDEITAFAERRGLDPADRETRLAWARTDVTPDDPRLIPWPPERNRPCWCGSGRKYKKCCGSAARR